MCIRISYTIFEPGSIERSQDLLVNTAIIPSKRDISGETVADEFELPLFDLSTLAVATEDFSDANKLGQGGFGCVYKVKTLKKQKLMLLVLVKNVVISMSDPPKILYYGGCNMGAVTFLEDHSNTSKSSPFLHLQVKADHVSVKRTYAAQTRQKCDCMHSCQILQKYVTLND